MEIKDKVVIVTGASQGIGLSSAKAISEAGAKAVILAARSKDLLEQAHKEIKNSHIIICDMRQESDVKNLIKETIDKFSRVDLLINNAGQGMLGHVSDMDIDAYRQIMELNVYSVVQAMQEAIPVMRKQGGGMIVNISSQVSKMYLPGYSAYSSTKYALNAISLIARQELEKDNITVSLLHPGLTATNFHRNLLGKNNPRPSGPMPTADSSEKVAQRLLELIKTEEPELLV